MKLFKNSEMEIPKKKRGKYKTVSINSELVGQAMAPLLVTLGLLKPDEEIADITVDGKVKVELEFKTKKD